MQSLPDYFLVDLSKKASLTPKMITDACETLKRNRRTYLLCRSTEMLIRTLGSLSEKWLDPQYPLRQKALAEAEKKGGFPRQTIENGLDHLFGEITPEGLRSLIEQDLGNANRIDHVSATHAEMQTKRKGFVVGPELIANISGGQIPNPIITSIIIGLLSRSAQFVKCAKGSAFLPRLFAHSIYETDPKLASCLEISQWKGGDETLEKPLFDSADFVIATGNDHTIETLSKRIPKGKRFLPYGHRVSFGYITKSGLEGSHLRLLSDQIIEDVVSWNQVGCLSPHVIYVERGTSPSPEHLAEHIAKAFGRREEIEPRGEIGKGTAAIIANRRRLYEVRAAHSKGTLIWKSEGSTSWTLVFDCDPRFQKSCAHRFLYIKSVDSLSDALAGAEEVFGKVACVGLAASPNEAEGIVKELARWGVGRVCPFGKMQKPSIAWRHDGMPSLGTLMHWTDWEI